jgi:probable rRNA maturation factor
MAVARRFAVVLLNRQRARRVEPARLRRVLGEAAAALRVSGELALVLAGDRTVRTLNARYRGKDKSTDVLSFPGPCGGHARSETSRRRAAHCSACARGEGELGDVVISVPTAERNARRLGRTLPRELDVLALHGFLHLLGYDHETDNGTMDRLERRLRMRLLGSAQESAAPDSPRRRAGRGGGRRPRGGRYLPQDPPVTFQ